MALTKVILCTPSKKKQLGLGNTVTKSYTMTNKEAKKLEAQYERYELGQAIVTAAVVGVLGIGIAETVAAMVGYAIGSSVATGIAGDFFEALDNDFGEIARSGCKFNKIELKYVYKRHGGNDGAYFLSRASIK
ncbi:hypothetical protein [Wukongibacter sp. M2B1]|uniref:hypothetical protein n=1 Tax=Wukongibacter sp. M2B1 TaxID=3088895 RepID=UPI003D7B6395